MVTRLKSNRLRGTDILHQSDDLWISCALNTSEPAGCCFFDIVLRTWNGKFYNGFSKGTGVDIEER